MFDTNFIYPRGEWLMGFKRPYRIMFVDGFPTTAGSNGEKIKKNELRDKAMDFLAIK